MGCVLYEVLAVCLMRVAAAADLDENPGAG